MAEEIYTAKNESFVAVADAIRKKTGKVDSLAFPDDFVNEIDSISGGGGAVSVPEKDVNFYDYDGTCLYAYTVDEIAALTELPAAPEHEGLISQGWNWTLGELQSLKHKATVGACYSTDDGSTRIHIRLRSDLDLTFSFNAAATVVGGILIDWGDGAQETNTATENTKYTHTYAAVGTYIITISATDGEIKSFRVANDTNADNTTVEAVEIGQNFSLDNSAFRYCGMLQTIILSQGCETPEAYGFSECTAVKAIIFPRDFVFANMYVFYELNRAVTCSLPGKATFKSSADSYFSSSNIEILTFPTSPAAQSIPTEFAGYLKNLLYVCIPASITAISARAFNQCVRLKEIHFLSETPPALAAATCLGTPSEGEKIYIPKGSLENYQDATNWANYVDYLEEE